MPTAITIMTTVMGMGITITTTTTMNTNPMLAWAAALWAEEARRAALNARLAAFERDEKAP